MVDKKPYPLVRASNIQYIIAVVAMFGIGMTAIVLVSTLSPSQDLGVVIAIVSGILTPTTLSLMAFMKAQETHLSVNSRLDQFIKNADTSARAEGAIEGARIANERTDNLAKGKKR